MRRPGASKSGTHFLRPRRDAKPAAIVAAVAAIIAVGFVRNGTRISAFVTVVLAGFQTLSSELTWSFISLVFRFTSSCKAASSL